MSRSGEDFKALRLTVWLSINLVDGRKRRMPYLDLNNFINCYMLNVNMESINLVKPSSRYFPQQQQQQLPVSEMVMN